MINRQIAQLDQVLQRTSSTPEHRSLSGESVKKYDVEGSDHIQNCEYIRVIIFTINSRIH